MRTHPGDPPRGLRALPIWRDALRLTVLLEEAVRGFPRYHKYALGTDLRRGAMRVVRLVGRAYHARGARAPLVGQLVEAVDDLKLLIQLGKELRAFRSFAEFQAAAELAVQLGRQSGGWLKRAGPEAGGLNDRP